MDNQNNVIQLQHGELTKECKLLWQPQGGSMVKEGSTPLHYSALTLTYTATTTLSIHVYTITHIWIFFSYVAVSFVTCAVISIS